MIRSGPFKGEMIGGMDWWVEIWLVTFWVVTWLVG